MADTDNQRIEKFDPSGNFLSALGKNVNLVAGATDFNLCTQASACMTGEAGTLPGQFDDPDAVATDAAGDFYVSDLLNNRI